MFINRLVESWSLEVVLCQWPLRSHTSGRNCMLAKSIAGPSTTITMVTASTTFFTFSPKGRSLAQKMLHWRGRCFPRWMTSPLWSHFRKLKMRTFSIALAYKSLQHWASQQIPRLMVFLFDSYFLSGFL